MHIQAYTYTHEGERVYKQFNIDISTDDPQKPPHVIRLSVCGKTGPTSHHSAGLKSAQSENGPSPGCEHINDDTVGNTALPVYRVKVQMQLFAAMCTV